MIFRCFVILLWINILNSVIIIQPLFTWLYGYKTLNPYDLGSYSQKNVEGEGNYPQTRINFGFTSDDDGKYLYLFGGCQTFGSQDGELNDLWRFTVSTGQWTWLFGSPNSYDPGVYGNVGQSNSSYYPSVRQGASMVYHDGKVYVFGGYFIGKTFNELWKYDTVIQEWAWISGDKGSYAKTASNFGILGVESSTNMPWSRLYHSMVCDHINEYLYLFGGQASGVNNGNMAEVWDLWRYNINTGYWTWIGGSNTPSYSGNYIDKGIESHYAMPAARYQTLLLIDDSMQFLFIFGGRTDSDYLNDLWKFNTNSQAWTWISGKKFIYEIDGVYDQIGIESNSIFPGSRWSSFGYYDLNCIYIYGGRYYDDFWKFNLSSDMWTLLKGNRYTNISPNYTTFGLTEPQNDPGSIGGVGSWASNQKKLFMFADSEGDPNSGPIDDAFNLWEMTPVTYNLILTTSSSQVSLSPSSSVLSGSNVNHLEISYYHGFSSSSTQSNIASPTNDLLVATTSQNAVFDSKSQEVIYIIVGIFGLLVLVLFSLIWHLHSRIQKEKKQNQIQIIAREDLEPKEFDPFELKNVVLETNIDKLLGYSGEVKDILYFSYQQINQELGITKEEYERIGAYKKKHLIREEPDLETKEIKGNAKGKAYVDRSESQISLPNMPKESKLNHDDLENNIEAASSTSNHNETSKNDSKSKQLKDNPSEVENTRNEPSINSPKSKKHSISPQFGNTSENTTTNKNETNQSNIHSHTNLNEQ